jgi:hypothetical protein
VIKLTNIINEISDELLKKKTYSWQKPDGTFIPVEYSHGSHAFKINGGQPNEDHIMNLWKKGWQRITSSAFLSCLYAHNEVMKPNDRQKSRLIDLAKELQFEKVEWDDGEGSYNVLWSIHDVLEESN